MRIFKGTERITYGKKVIIKLKPNRIFGFNWAWYGEGILSLTISGPFFCERRWTFELIPEWNSLQCCLSKKNLFNKIKISSSYLPLYLMKKSIIQKSEKWIFNILRYDRVFLFFWTFFFTRIYIKQKKLIIKITNKSVGAARFKWISIIEWNIGSTSMTTDRATKIGIISEFNHNKSWQLIRLSE